MTREARASTQTNEHDVMSTNQTGKDGKDLCEDNDPSSPHSSWNWEASSSA